MILPTQAEYSSTKVLNATEMPKTYKDLISLLPGSSIGFPIDKAVMFLRHGERKSRIELVCGDKFLSVEKRGEDSVVIRAIDLANEVTGLEEIFTHDGNYTESNIRVERGVKGNAVYSTLGAPVIHETGQVEFCKDRISAVSKLLYSAQVNFIKVLLDKAGGTLSYQGISNPDLVKQFVQVMGLDAKCFSPDKTVIQHRRLSGGDIDVVEAVTADITASIEVEAERGTSLALTWRGSSGMSIDVYDNLSGTVSRTYGRFEIPGRPDAFKVGELSTDLPLSDNDIARKQAAYALYQRILSL